MNMVARIRELSTPPKDDHDRAVLLLCDQYEALLQQGEPEGWKRRYEALEYAAAEFVRKCESGKARSRESYQQFKDALALSASPLPATGAEDTHDLSNYAERTPVTIRSSSNQTLAKVSSDRQAALEEAAKLDGFAVLHGAMLCIAQWPEGKDNFREYASNVAERVGTAVAEAFVADCTRRALATPPAGETE